MFVVAIDGPSGAGKSSLAKEISKHFKIMYLDTGALYRAVGQYFVSRNLDYNDENFVSKSLEEIHINLEYCGDSQIILVNNEDITSKIRTNEVSMAASRVSSYKSVRDFLMDTQRETAKKNSVVMDGRDIGTVVFPNADLKIFLTASVGQRAKRRYKELKNAGQNVRYEEVLSLIEQRDFNDTNRKVAPLRPAEDALILDSTDCTFDEMKNKLIDIIKEKIK